MTETRVELGLLETEALWEERRRLARRSAQVQLLRFSVG